jgi:hypothetical protein
MQVAQFICYFFSFKFQFSKHFTLLFDNSHKWPIIYLLAYFVILTHIILQFDEHTGKLLQYFHF